MKWLSVILTFVLMSVALADVDNGDDTLNNLLTSNLGGLDTSQFNISQAPTIEDAERLFKEKCLKNADMAAYDTAAGAKDVAKECVMSLVNVTELQKEMEDAKPTGDLDVVFKKYCRKSPMLRSCISNFTQSMEPCLEAAERENKHIIQNVTDSLLQFICYKEGDRIALFIAEGGPECLSSHQEGIQLCINETLKKHLPTSVPSLTDLPQIILGPEECKAMREVQTCVVTKLETCKEPTPANIVESMFNFVYKVTPCGKMAQQRVAALEDSGTGATGGATRTAFMTLTTSILTFVVARLV